MRTHLTVIFLGVCLAISLGGCAKAVEPVESASPTAVQTQTNTNVARPQLPNEFIERIDGSTATIPLTTAALRMLRGSEAGLNHNATIEAYENLITAKKDVIFVTAPSKEELAAAKEAGVELEVIPVVKDALVFLANKANKANNLSQQQVKDIYTGKITNWNKVGGNNQPIIPYQRQINSGSQTLFLQLAMQDTIPMDAQTDLRISTMNELVDAITEYDNSQNALGYSVYYYTQQMYIKDNAKLLQIDGIMPTNQSISDETYPYLTYYYAVIRSSEPANSLSRQLIDWLLCPEAQQMASGTGYVPLEAANIVQMRQDYGYYGSTPENTTQSSGTGGPVGSRPTAVKDPCPDYYSKDGEEEYVVHMGCFADQPGGGYQVAIPGYPEAQAAAQAWYDSLVEIPRSDSGRFETVFSSDVGFDLIQFQRIIWTGGSSYNDTITLRLKDGHIMTLADFFYDNVNYISFINENLFNLATNQPLAECKTDEESEHESCGFSIVAPFTGLPSTYNLFSHSIVANPVYPSYLAFHFPIDNPFLVNPDNGAMRESRVSLNLPADLSPYGIYWRFNQVKIDNTQVDHLVRNFNDASPVDQVLNNQLDALVVKHPEAAAVRIYGFTADVIEVHARGRNGFVDPSGVYKFNYNTGKPI